MQPELFDHERHVVPKESNREKILAYIEQAIKAKVDLISFPELILTGAQCRGEFFKLAEPIPGRSTKLILDKLKDTSSYVTLGMPELRNGFVYNSAPLMGPHGLVGVWRKPFLPNLSTTAVVCDESMWFKKGNALETFDTSFGKLGIEICYDFWFPEITRTHALRGALLLINLSAARGKLSESFQLLARVRAMENISWFGYVNCVGIQAGWKYTGGTCIVDQGGNIVKSASIGEDAKEEVVEHEIDFDAAIQARLGRSILRDVRADMLRLACKAAQEI
jgi:predicted amidohydrolase